MSTRFTTTTLAAFTLCVAAPAIAQAPFADRLTADWGGTRTQWADRGVSIDADWTQYYQGLLEGTGPKSWEYGGRFDANLTFDTGKLGWWQGGTLKVHGEYFYGDIDPTLGGTLVPTNAGVRLPNPGDGGPEVTQIALTQRLPFGALILGKINTPDLLQADPFWGGLGVSRFLNLGFVAPPNGLLPPVIFGAILVVPAQPVALTFMVFDPEDRSTDYLPDDLFDSGVNVSAGAKWSGAWAGRSSNFGVTAIYSSGERADLGGVLLPPELALPNRKDSWHGSVQVAHFLYEPAGAPGQGFGLFGKFGWSDGNPNPYQAFFSGGVGGRGLFASRPDDRFGLGYFYYDISDDLRAALGPLIELGSERGYEAYYDVGVARGVRIAADLQYVSSALPGFESGWVAGMRLRLAL